MFWLYSQLRPVKNGGHVQKVPRIQVPPFLQQLRLSSESAGEEEQHQHQTRVWKRPRRRSRHRDPSTVEYNN